MVFEAIKEAFRSIFGGGSQETTDGGILVWMPQFVQRVEENTDKLNRKARRLRFLASKIRSLRSLQNSLLGEE